MMPALFFWTVLYSVAMNAPYVRVLRSTRIFAFWLVYIFTVLGFMRATCHKSTHTFQEGASASRARWAAPSCRTCTKTRKSEGAVSVDQMCRSASLVRRDAFSRRFEYEHRGDALGKCVSSERSSHVEVWPQAKEGMHSFVAPRHKTILGLGKQDHEKKKNVVQQKSFSTIERLYRSFTEPASL